MGERPAFPTNPLINSMLLDERGIFHASSFSNSMIMAERGEEKGVRPAFQTNALDDTLVLVSSEEFNASEAAGNYNNKRLNTKSSRSKKVKSQISLPIVYEPIAPTSSIAAQYSYSEKSVTIVSSPAPQRSKQSRSKSTDQVVNMIASTSSMAAQYNFSEKPPTDVSSPAPQRSKQSRSKSTDQVKKYTPVKERKRRYEEELQLGNDTNANGRHNHEENEQLTNNSNSQEKEEVVKYSVGVGTQPMEFDSDYTLCSAVSEAESVDSNADSGSETEISDGNLEAEDNSFSTESASEGEEDRIDYFSEENRMNKFSVLIQPRSLLKNFLLPILDTQMFGDLIKWETRLDVFCVIMEEHRQYIPTDGAQPEIRYVSLSLPFRDALLTFDTIEVIESFNGYWRFKVTDVEGFKKYFYSPHVSPEQQRELLNKIATIKRVRLQAMLRQLGVTTETGKYMDGYYGVECEEMYKKDKQDEEDDNTEKVDIDSQLVLVSSEEYNAGEASNDYHDKPRDNKSGRSKKTKRQKALATNYEPIASTSSMTPEYHYSEKPAMNVSSPAPKRIKRSRSKSTDQVLESLNGRCPIQTNNVLNNMEERKQSIDLDMNRDILKTQVSVVIKRMTGDTFGAMLKNKTPRKRSKKLSRSRSVRRSATEKSKKARTNSSMARNEKIIKKKLSWYENSTEKLAMNIVGVPKRRSKVSQEAWASGLSQKDDYKII